MDSSGMNLLFAGIFRQRLQRWSCEAHCGLLRTGTSAPGGMISRDRETRLLGTWVLAIFFTCRALHGVFAVWSRSVSSEGHRLRTGLKLQCLLQDFHCKEHWNSYGRPRLCCSLGSVKLPPCLTLQQVNASQAASLIQPWFKLTVREVFSSSRAAGRKELLPKDSCRNLFRLCKQEKLVRRLMTTSHGCCKS